VAAGQYQKKKVEKKKATGYSGKTAYLTFDDGPSSNTGRILDELNRQGIKATFFVIGNSSNAGRSMYKKIAGEGHQLGNHTYSHNYSSIYSSVQNFIGDFLRLENLLQETVGIKPGIIRYPGGSNNTVSHRYGGAGIMRQIISEMSNRGYTHCDWNVDAGDATSAINNKSAIVRNVLSQAAGKDKAIVLLHDAEYQKNTPVALREIIQGLRAQGFAFDVLSKNSFLVQFTK
jgi:peptidoglycan-N-acetylglucosamine deacetylase